MRIDGVTEKPRTISRSSAMFRVLNTNLAPVVTMIPGAEPDVRFMKLHGERVVFDANSLCAAQVDRATFSKLKGLSRGPYRPALRGLLFCREKPQFRPPRAGGVRRVVLNVTHGCNLACSYCFAGGDRPGAVMSAETARAAMEMIAPGGAIDLAFFGGEPLLAWPRAGETMDAAGRLARERKGGAEFHITTNGTLLDAEKAREIARRNCSLLVSLDGPEEIHNAARPLRSGGGSFAGAMAGIEAAAGAGIARRVMARATFAGGNSRLVERLEFLAGLQEAGLIAGFSVEPAVLTEGCATRSPTDPTDRTDLAGEYHDAAEWFVARVRAGRGAGFFHFRKMLGRILRARHAGTECGAGNGYVTVSPDGTIHACHREGTPVGGDADGVDEQARWAWWDNRVYTRPRCMTCWARYLCGGGCRQGRSAGRCRAQRIMLKECLWILTQTTRQELGEGGDDERSE
jgi:uncharacterized protein